MCQAFEHAHHCDECGSNYIVKAYRQTCARYLCRVRDCEIVPYDENRRYGPVTVGTGGDCPVCDYNRFRAGERGAIPDEDFGYGQAIVLELPPLDGQGEGDRRVRADILVRGRQQGEREGGRELPRERGGRLEHPQGRGRRLGQRRRRRRCRPRSLSSSSAGSRGSWASAHHVEYEHVVQVDNEPPVLTRRAFNWNRGQPARGQ